MPAWTMQGNDPRWTIDLPVWKLSHRKHLKHDLMREVGMKSSGHDLPGILDNSFLTSSGVTGGILSNLWPEWYCSWNGCMLVSKFDLSIIVRFKFRILETKKSENRVHRLAHSSSGRIVSVELEWSKSFTVRHFCFGSVDSVNRSRMKSVRDSLIRRLAVRQALRYATRSDSSFVDFQMRSRRRLSRFADLAAGERNFVIGFDGLRRVVLSGATLSSSSVTISWICWANPSTVVEGFVKSADSRRDAWNFSRSMLFMRLEATGTAGTIGVTGIWRVATMRRWSDTIPASSTRIFFTTSVECVARTSNRLFSLVACFTCWFIPNVSKMSSKRGSTEDWSAPGQFRSPQTTIWSVDAEISEVSRSESCSKNNSDNADDDGRYKLTIRNDFRPDEILTSWYSKVKKCATGFSLTGCAVNILLSYMRARPPPLERPPAVFARWVCSTPTRLGLCPVQ